MKLSIITPWYEGARYMAAYEAMALDNLNNLNPGQSMEILLVNDSPWEEIRLDRLAPYLCGGEAEAGAEKQTDASLTVRVIVNSRNAGIQASRVNGLQHSQGEYILFLDQDDTLTETAVRDFLCAAQEENDNLRAALISSVTDADEVLAADMYVANARLEQKDGSYEIWYREPYHKKKIGSLSAYINIGTQIISPGQVMLPKALIPDAYMDNLLQRNGADDYFLWLLLLSDGTEVHYIDKPLYTHHFTGENLSADTRITDASAYEFLDIMEEKCLMKPAQIKRLRRMLAYKDAFRHSGSAGKILASLKNIDILIPNIIFKWKTRTPYGYNR